MKICIVTTVHSPFDTRIFQKEANTLAKAGYDVVLVVQHEHDEIINGIKLIALKKRKSRLFRIMFSGKEAFDAAMKQRADAYHFHDPELLPWMLYLRKKTGARILYDVHENVSQDILSKEWIPVYLRKIISIFFGIYEKKAVSKIDRVIASTCDIASNFKKEKTTVINNYPIISGGPKDVQEMKKKNFRNTLIYVGGLDDARGIEKIVLSLRFINPKYNAKLKIIGSFSEDYFERRIRRMPEWKKVEFMGFLPQKEAYKQMREASAGLVCFLPKPNHINAMPNKMFEYMLAGIPVIASNFQLWKKIIETDNCGVLVDPMKPREIAKAAELLLENSAMAKMMGENGRKAIIEKYNWESESKKLLEIYRVLFNL